MHYVYKPKGVCAKQIEFDINDGIVSNTVFTGGCHGNLKAISKLTEGMSYDKIAGILSGNTCGMRNTSCADQFAKAVTEAYNVENGNN